MNCNIYIKLDDVIWCLDGEQASAALVEQYVWRKWGQMDRYPLSTPLPLRQLFQVARDLGLLSAPPGQNLDNAIEDSLHFIRTTQNMFLEYWGMQIEVLDQSQRECRRELAERTLM